MEGLKRSVTFLKSQDLQLAAIITDRNRQVKMLVYTLGQMDVSLCSTLEKKVLLSQSHPKYTTFICYRLLSGCGRSCAQKERAITSISGTSVKVCDLIVMLCNWAITLCTSHSSTKMFAWHFLLMWNRCEKSIGRGIKREGLWGPEAVEASAH